MFTKIIGALGALTGLLNAHLWWRVLSSPGDDNPVALIFAFGVLASVVPTSGLFLRARARWTVGRAIWALLSIAIVGLFGVMVAYVFNPFR